MARAARPGLIALAVLTVVLSTVQVVGTASPARADAIGFGKGVLAGATGAHPTSLQFGPDGRLYVLHQDGAVTIHTVVRHGRNDYAVTATTTLRHITAVPNHDDDGDPNAAPTTTACTVPCRQATGLVVSGTAAAPVLYVSSSDPRVGGEPGMDTNSGVVSRLAWNAASATWTSTDIVRGLPRSQNNHSINGMALDEATGTLYLAAGGHTNQGAPGRVFSDLPEYALSAAILSIDLDAIGTTTYDLPTLDDGSRANDPARPGWDVGDPFGGNDGANQARIVPGGPVQVHSPGYRNPYDVLLATVGAHTGRMYTMDNGYNAGQGGPPVGEGTAGCTNAPNDTSPATGYDSLHLVTGPGYYGGHPNPTRGNTANTFGGQSPVPAGNPLECDFRRAAQPGVPSERTALASDPSSSNGLAEYTASNFGGALRGDLLAAAWDGYVTRYQLDAAGTSVLTASRLFSDVSVHPLDVTTVGDAGPFPGTIWLADHVSGAIIVFEPTDYDGAGSPCTGADDPALDEDGDGYTNADEIDNATDPCSTADQPQDRDDDGISDRNDPDDDGDTRPDTSDAWAVDPDNGTTTALPLNHPFDDTTDPDAGGLLNLGFTGLMTNGRTDYGALFDPTALTAGGAGGVLTVDRIGPGDAAGAANTQANAFQYGFATPPANGGVLTPHTRVLTPFAGITRRGTESIGLQFGTGDQDNYVSVVVATAAGGSIRLRQEVAGSTVTNRSVRIALPTTGSVDLFLAVNRQTRQAQASYQLRTGTTTGPRTAVGAPITLPASWFTRPALASGVIATSGGAPAFPATWDLFEVQYAPYRPDARVRLSSAGAFVGNDVYNSTGAGQTASVTTGRGTTRAFVVSVQNDGPAADGFRLRGPGSSPGFTVRYFAGTRDITAAVVDGTYVMSGVAVGGARSIQMRVTVASGAAPGSSRSSLVTATSTHSGVAVDAVRTVVTVG